MHDIVLTKKINTDIQMVTTSIVYKVICMDNNFKEKFKGFTLQRESLKIIISHVLKDQTSKRMHLRLGNEINLTWATQAE